MVAAELYGCCVDGIYQHGGVQNMDYGLILRKRSLWRTDVHGFAGSIGVMMVMTPNDGIPMKQPEPDLMAVRLWSGPAWRGSEDMNSQTREEVNLADINSYVFWLVVTGTLV